jgi:hypothetical protein
MMSTFEAVCVILNEVYMKIRTKRNLTDPECLNERICYEDSEQIVLKALTDFINSYAEGKYGEGS